MKSLQVIQKAFRVFQILAKIAFVFCIVGASMCALGALCCAVWRTGGEVFSLFGTPVTRFVDADNLGQTQAMLYGNLIFLTVDAVLLGFAGQYFKAEQQDGTPFTQRGANMLLRLGVRCIWMPIVSVVLAALLSAWLGAKGGDFSNLPSVATGIVLILASLIFRYGAELAEQNRALLSGREGAGTDGSEEIQ